MNYQKGKIKDIAQKYKIRDIYIFGSEVTGFKHPGSDFDLGIIFSQGLPSLDKRMKIYGQLFNDFSAIFPNKKLDLVFLEETPLHLRFKALTEGELIYSVDLEKAFNYKEKICNLYRDYKYFIDEFYEGILEAPIS